MWERLSPWSGIQNKWKLRCATFYFITSAAIKGRTSGTTFWQIDKISGLEGKSRDIYKNATRGIYWMKEQVLWANMEQCFRIISSEICGKRTQVIWSLGIKQTGQITFATLSHHNGLYYHRQYFSFFLLQINTYCGFSSKHWNVHQGWLLTSFFFFFKQSQSS